ncbi:MAG: hypothetical protein ACE5K1_03670 [Acidiferrobacterales bacterium]
MRSLALFLALPLLILTSTHASAQTPNVAKVTTAVGLLDAAAPKTLICGRTPGRRKCGGVDPCFLTKDLLNIANNSVPKDPENAQRLSFKLTSHIAADESRCECVKTFIGESRWSDFLQNLGRTPGDWTYQCRR